MATEDTAPVHVEPPSTARPTLGRIVLYVGLDGTLCPAIVVGLGRLTSDVNLQVFIDGGPHGVKHRQDVPFSTAPDANHSWHWPPRVP